MFEVDLSVFDLKGLRLYSPPLTPRLYSSMLGSVQGSETSRILGLCMLELRGYNWTHKEILTELYSMIRPLRYLLIGVFRVEPIKCVTTEE